MRKLILSFLILVIVAAVGLPYVCGIMAEKQLHKVVRSMSEHPNVFASVRQYNRGWLHADSTIDVKLTLNNRKLNRASPVNLPHVLNFTLKQNIIHGPIIRDGDNILFGQALIKNNIKLAPDMQKQLEKFFNGDTHLSINNSLFIKLLGDSVFNMEMKPFNLNKPKQRLTISSNGFKATSSFDKNMALISSHFHSDGLTMTGTDKQGSAVTVKLGALTAKRTRKAESYHDLWAYKFTMQSPSITVTKSKQRLLHVSPVYVTVDTGIKDNLFSVSVLIKLDKVNVEKQIYGPVKFSFNMKNLNANALIAVDKKINGLYNSQMSDQQRKMMMMSLMPNMLKIVAGQNTQFILEAFNIHLPQGKFLAKGAIHFPTGGGTNILAMLKTRGQFEMRATQSLVKLLLSQRLKQALMRHQSSSAVQARQMAQYNQALTQSMQHNKKNNGQTTHINVNSAANNAPQSLSEMTPEQITQQANAMAQTQLDQLIASGMLQSKNDDYFVDVRFSDGRLTVNGKPIPLFNR